METGHRTLLKPCTIQLGKYAESQERRGKWASLLMGSKERERSGNTSSSSSSSNISTNGISSSSSSSSSNGLGVDMMSHSVSPVATSSPSSGQESCTSSASTTPPPSFDGAIISSSPPCSSPVPVSCVQGLCQDESSPLPTPPSSLSSSSEPSSSLSLPQQFSRSAATVSLFSDNNNKRGEESVDK
ncbi:hypothetical protein E2C01_027363 [Portunus trituberculatus]|uniref:Uncharacterized protein n=1 Tax=Portunus trituberculatus TaxID=210409 RepID=A0A5B7EIJ0_PORTR|nr:hypothetical protein [Portunus trituberculatus]